MFSSTRGNTKPPVLSGNQLRGSKIQQFDDLPNYRPPFSAVFFPWFFFGDFRAIVFQTWFLGCFLINLRQFLCAQGRGPL